MTNNLSEMSVEKLRRAVAIKEQIEALETELSNLSNGSVTRPTGLRRGRKPKVKADADARGTRKPKRKKQTARGRAISERMKARWAEVKKAGKSAL